jgi:hypothetical protein
LRLAELLVHGFDFAWATGYAAMFPDDVAELELVFSRQVLANSPANIPPDCRPFALPQAVSDGAMAIDRLVALLGRRVDQPAGSG